MHWSFGEWSPSDVGLPNVDIFIKNIFKLTVANITISLIRKVEELGRYQAHKYKFSKTLVFTWKLLLLATKTVSCFPWSDKFTLPLLKKMTAKYLRLNNQSLSILSSKNGVPLKKQLNQHATQTMTRAFPEDNYHVLVCSRNALGKLPILSDKIVKRYLRKGLDLIKLIIFYCFLKDILNWNWQFFFFKLQACVKEDYNDC